MTVPVPVTATVTVPVTATAIKPVVPYHPSEAITRLRKIEMKKYQIIYADPPWKLKAGSPNLHAKKQGNRELKYPTMSVEQICSLPIKNIADNNCVLFLWTTNKYIEDSYKVARDWGFVPSTMLVWCKNPKGRGLGGTFGISTEYLLFARKGSLVAEERHWSTWFEAKRGKHSEKPKIARDIIEKCFDGVKIELFARQKTEGWDVWGNEVENDIELPPPEITLTSNK